MRQKAFRKTYGLQFQKVADLRYGENPHQKAAMYADGSGAGVANARQVQGKELSYNNMVDLQATWICTGSWPGAALRSASPTTGARAAVRKGEAAGT